MSGFLLGVLVGGAVLFLCPGLGVGGNAWFKRARNFFEGL